MMQTQSVHRERFVPVKKAAARRPHGTRAKYISGCKCLRCRAANSNYCVARERAREAGDMRNIVPAATAREHILQLGVAGIGYKMVAAAADVAVTVVADVRSGKKLRIRQNTERKILAVDEKAFGDATLIDAGPTWRKLDDLIERGYTRSQLAQWLGNESPALQIKRHRITAKTAMRVERMCALLDAGKLRRK